MPGPAVRSRSTEHSSTRWWITRAGTACDSATRSRSGTCSLAAAIAEGPNGADHLTQDRSGTTSARRRAGRWHDSRHTLITELAENGAGDETIMGIAGHVSRQMLSRYAHIRTEAKRRALEEAERNRAAAVERMREASKKQDVDVAVP